MHGWSTAEFPAAGCKRAAARAAALAQALSPKPEIKRNRLINREKINT
jgi:hypothetical protein